MQWECRFMWNFATISWKSLEKKYVSPIFRSDQTFLRWHYALSIIRLLLRHQPWLLSVWISNKICLMQWGHRLKWSFLAISWSSLEKKHVGPIVRSDRKFLQWHYSALSPRGGVHWVFYVFCWDISLDCFHHKYYPPRGHFWMLETCHYS